MRTIVRIPTRLLAAVAVVATLAGPLLLVAADPAVALDPGYAIQVSKSYIGGATDAGDLPDCGPRNITGRGKAAGIANSATWAIQSTIPNGAVVEVGDEWQVRGSVAGLGAPNTNDGPDPLNLGMQVLGPVTKVGSVVGEADHGPGEVFHGGEGFTGAVGPVGAWGYEFDMNSDPGVGDVGDGAQVRITTTLRATAPGIVQLHHLDVYGYDGTPIAGDFSCQLVANWSWTVDAVDVPPTSGPDLAFVDSTYPLVAFDDANGGTHAVEIDVLANDDDPNTPGGGSGGDTTQVRIRDWQPLSVEGGTVSCGTDGQKGTATFSQMSTGPCTYTPPSEFEGLDRFGYLLRSVSGLERFVWVDVQLVRNRAPAVGSPEYVMTDGDTIVNGNLGQVITDPDGDPVTCSKVTEPDPDPDPNTDQVSVDADCTFDFDPAGATGEMTFVFRSCDTNDLLSGDGFGQHVDPAPGYDQGDPDDLSATTSRRCRDRIVTVTVIDDNQTLLIPPVGGTDVSVVDAGYAGEGIGPFHLRIPVLANDVDYSDAQFPNDGIGGLDLTAKDAELAFDPAMGTATFDIDEGTDTYDLLFTPAEGVEGSVEFQYRICDDPAQQDPPIEDDPDTPLVDESVLGGVCGFGLVSIYVVPNDPPLAGPDQVLTSSIDDVVDLDVKVNDTDPLGEPLTCTPGSLGDVPAELFSAAMIDADCLVDLTPVPGAEGVADLTYSVCDAHQLSQPGFADDPYGPGGIAPDGFTSRCSTGVLTATVVAPAADEPDLFDLDPGPTCAADAAVTTAGEAITVPVLLNDADTDFAGEPSPLEVSGVGTADAEDVSEHGGSLSTSTKAVTYVPAEGFSGADSFTYGAVDAVGHGCSATVDVMVEAAAVNRGTLPATGQTAGGEVALGLQLLGLGAALRLVSRKVARR